MIALDQRFLMRNNQGRRDAQAKRDQAWDEEEETLTYAPYRKEHFINEPQGTFKGAFDEAKSLNKAPNIFDATAVFHVNKG